MRPLTRAWAAGLPNAFFFAIAGLLVALSIWSVVSAPANMSGADDDPRSQLAAEVRALTGAAPETPKYGQPPPPMIPTQIMFGLFALIALAFVGWALLNMNGDSPDDSSSDGDPRLHEQTRFAVPNTTPVPPPAPLVPEWLKAAFRETGEAIVAIDSNCRIVSANPAAERMFGYDSGKLAGRTAVELLPEVGATRDTLRRFSQVAAPARACGAARDGIRGDFMVSVKKLSDRPDSQFLAIITPMPAAAPAPQQQQPAALPETAAPAVTAPATTADSLNAAALSELENQLLLSAGHGEMLLAAIAPTDTAYADARAALRSASRAALLCHEIKTAKPVPQARPVDLNRFLDDFALRLQSLLDDDCDVHVIRGNSGAAVLADPEMLERALCSLALHAREWAGGIRTAKISATKTRLDLRLLPTETAPNPPPARRTSDLLPAVDWIEAQGGAVEMEEHSDTGIRFRLLMPGVQESGVPASATASAAD